MNRGFFLSFILYSLFVASSLSAAESQSWTLRPGDSLETIAAALEIPQEEIRKHNPGIRDSNLQIGQKLTLPLQSYQASKALQDDRSRKGERIAMLETANDDLKRQVASAESQLRWQPLWFWGFWICFGIVAFVAGGAFWIFRQTHPKVFEEPRDRTVGDLRESQLRLRSFPREDKDAAGYGMEWHAPLKRVHAHR
jgi:hypothetical protein